MVDTGDGVEHSLEAVVVLEKGVKVSLKTAVVRRQRVKVKVGLKTAVGWREGVARGYEAVALLGEGVNVGLKTAVGGRRSRHGGSRDRRDRIVVGDGNVFARRERVFVACRSPR